MAASETGFSCPRDIGTRQRCPPYTGERPKRRGHARHARRSTLCMVVAGYHPPTRTYASHQRATLKPIALGESGWASRVARASQIRTNPRGRRVRHFGARNRIFCYRIRWPEGPPSAWAPRRARRSLGIDSEALGAGFVPIRARSCAVPAGLLLGVVSSQHHLERLERAKPRVASGAGRGFCLAQARA